MSESSKALVDGKAPIHFLVGFVAGMSGLNQSWATVVVIGFEAVLVALEEGMSAPFERRSPQSQGNQVVDTLIGILGASVGEAVRKSRQTSMQISIPSLNPATDISGISYVHANRW